ncbi:MAG: hypothetical protein ACF8XB_13580 [Planctomycetota bacterium JB042]
MRASLPRARRSGRGRPGRRVPLCGDRAPRAGPPAPGCPTTRPSRSSLLPCLLLAAIAPGASFAGDECVRPRTLPAAAEGLDPRIEFFSPAIDADPGGAGLAWEPDESCPDEAALELTRIRFDGLVADRKEWLAERRGDVERVLGGPSVHVRTAHFDLAFAVDDLKVGRRKVRRSDGAALYAGRLEDHHAWVVATLGIDPVWMKRKNRHQVFVLSDREAAERVVTELLGHKLGGGFKSNLVGPEDSYAVVRNDPTVVESDAALHQILVHTVSHNVQHDVKRYLTWLNDRHGWLYDGLAHHAEIRRFGPPITTCHRDDQLDFEHWLSPHWEANIRRAIKQRRDDDPARLIDLSVDDMNPKHRQFAWSYVDFLLWYDAPKMADLLDRTKGEGMASADALREVYGFDLPTFWEEWKAFVVEHYSSRPRKGPTPARKPRKTR